MLLELRTAPDNALVLYRIINLILLPLLAVVAAIRVLRGIDRPADLWQRLRGPRVTEPVIWVHGASVGELQSLRPVIAALAPARVLVTANTTSGRDAATRWGMAHVQTALAPLDSRLGTAPLIGKTCMLVIAESELWPNRIAMCHAKGIPVVLLGARMSKASARNWGRFDGLARQLLGPVALIVPQDAGSATRLAERGAMPHAITAPVMLKSAFAADRPALPDDLADLSQQPVFLAAATHEGEDAIVLDAFQAARLVRPDLRLIIAPRHPERGGAIVALARISGLTVSRRSTGDAPASVVYVADTLGEMALWYQVADLVFVGGSLVDVGGHTPFEPVAYDCPILHGPFVANFADSYATLAQASAAVEVRDAATLTTAITSHLRDGAMAARARAALPPVDLTPVIAAVKALL